jgi:hypothetical protein
MGVGFIAETMAEILMEKKRKNTPFPATFASGQTSWPGGWGCRGRPAITTFAFLPDKPAGEAAGAFNHP